MTETLAEKTCTPCRGGVPPLARDEALHFQKQAPDWELRDDAHRIERTFRFRNFREALAFVQQVGELAGTEGHHPDISFGWGCAMLMALPELVKAAVEGRLPRAASASLVCAMLLPSGRANTRCSVCRFDLRGNFGRAQERVWRAQRPGAKIDAVGTSAGGRDRRSRI